MMYGAHELKNWSTDVEIAGHWYPARPLWVSWGRWRHAWWVLTGRCDAVWWPEDGNPYWGPQAMPVNHRPAVGKDGGT